MKFILGLYLVIALLVGVNSCSPVQFSDKPSGPIDPETGGTACGPLNPCVGPNGQLNVVEDFKFTNTNRVDILVVIDNSGSMSVEQANLGAPFNGFISNLNASGLDWQIGVTNTDVCPSPDGSAKYCPAPSGLPGAQGQMMGPAGSNPTYGSQYILNSAMQNAESVFNSIVQRGDEIGSGDERGIYAAILAVDKRNNENKGFFRDDSNFAVLILADEDERSSYGRQTDSMGQPVRDYAPLASYDMPDTLISKVSTAFQGTKNLSVNALIIKPNDSSCLSQQRAQPPKYTAEYGEAYAELAQKTGGISESLCDNGQGAFTNVLRNVTGAIKNQPQSKIISLGHKPSKAPVVTFIPASQSVGYNWNQGTNKIQLTTRPGSGTIVRVSYSYTK